MIGKWPPTVTGRAKCFKTVRELKLGNIPVEKEHIKGICVKENSKETKKQIRKIK